LTNPEPSETRADLATLPRLLQSQQFLPLNYLPGISQEQAAAALIDQILPKVENPDIDLVLATDEETLEGLVMIEPLPWDSGINGIHMGRVSMLYAAGDTREAAAIKLMLMQSAMQVAYNKGYQFLDFQPHVGDISSVQAASAMGFNVVGTCVCMVWDFSSGLDLVRSVRQVETATPADAPLLGEVSARSLDLHSRFVADPDLDPARAPEVFRQWAANAVQGYADHVNVIRTSDSLAGFTTWKFHKTLPKYGGRKMANLDLAAVVPEARRQGVLTALVQEGLRWLRQEEVPMAEVVTHVLNTGMQRACGQLGARTLAARHSMHWHVEE
jgi:GNAT superfamily N-acetyltransferase